MRPGRASDHSPPSSAAVMDYTSTHPLGHTGSVTGKFYLYIYSLVQLCINVRRDLVRSIVLYFFHIYGTVFSPMMLHKPKQVAELFIQKVVFVIADSVT